MSNLSTVRIFSVVFAVCLSGFQSLSAQVIDSEAISQLELIDIAGNTVQLSERNTVRVFCFLGVECPVARLYASRLNEIAKRYSDQNVVILGMNSNPHDSVADMKQFAKDLDLGFRQIKDTDQRIARAFGATRTAEVVVIDQQSQLQYRGRIDDQYAPGVKRAGPTSHELEEAIVSLLQSKPIKTAQTAPVGCLITYEVPAKPTSDLTYCKHIAPILYEHCLECHRPTEIGPFDISNYAELRGWADMIVEVIEQKRMPPWHAADSGHEFKNSRRMPAESLALIKRWVKDGAPYGNAIDLPVKPEFLDGWRLPKEPELVVSMRERPYTIPASGTIDYQYFVVDPQLTEDKWVSAAQVIPGCAAVVHHAIVFVRPPDGVESTGIGWLTAFVPGQRATTFPPGYARRVPAGSKLVFQMHYTPNGQEQSDTTKIGINFIESDQVTHEVFTLVGLDQEFEIPPHASNHEIASSMPWLPTGGELLAIMPHMHLRGKSFHLTAVAKQNESVGTESSTILKIPHYDFNWQHTYELMTPISLDAIERLNFTVAFDNSTNNPFNPNPEEYVMWGDQTWEEMAVAFLEVARPLATERTVSKVDSRKQKAATHATHVASVDQQDPRDTAFAEKLLNKFDQNKDGELTREEVSQIVRNYSFSRMDIDADGRVTRDELIAASRNSRD